MSKEELLIGYDVDVHSEGCMVRKRYAHINPEEVMDAVIADNSFGDIQKVVLSPKTIVLVDNFKD